MTPEMGQAELRAMGPNEVSSWDITGLAGYGSLYYMYTIIDVFSRYLVGWMIAKRGSAELAEKLIVETCVR